MGGLDALDDPMETQPSQVVAHHALGDLVLSKPKALRK